MNDEKLKLYFVLFAIHSEKEWAAHAGYVFSKKEENIKSLLDAIYGEVYIRIIEEVNYEEGTIFYGSRWSTFK